MTYMCWGNNVRPVLLNFSESRCSDFSFFLLGSDGKRILIYPSLYVFPLIIAILEWLLWPGLLKCALYSFIYLFIFLISLIFFYRNKNVMKIFSDRGIITKESPIEVAESSDVVITMLPSSASVSYGCNCSSTFGVSYIVNGVKLKT